MDFIDSFPHSSEHFGEREKHLIPPLFYTPSKGIYSKFGFSKIGVRPRYYSDNHEDAILMSLRHIQNAGFISFLQSTLDGLPYYHQSDN